MSTEHTHEHEHIPEEVYGVLPDEGVIELTDQLTGYMQEIELGGFTDIICLLYTSPSPRDVEESRMPSSA